MRKHSANCKVRARRGLEVAEMVRKSLLETETAGPASAPQPAVWQGQSSVQLVGGGWVWRRTSQDVWSDPCRGAACPDGGAQRPHQVEPRAYAITGVSHHLGQTLGPGQSKACWSPREGKQVIVPAASSEDDPERDLYVSGP